MFGLSFFSLFLLLVMRRRNGVGEEECKRNAYYSFVWEWEVQERKASEEHCGFMFGMRWYRGKDGGRRII